MKLAIAIPTYNEAANVRKLLPAIKKATADYPDLRCTVFVIDDNSPDGTADITEKLSAKLKTKDFSIRVIRRQAKNGLGRAYVFGFHHILKLDFDYVLQMDADLSHNPKYIPALLDAAKTADFVVGSRYIKGGATPDWSWNRKLLSRGGNLYTRLFLSSRITDYTGGYNLYATSLLERIDLDNLQAGGYGFLIELKYKALQNCNKVAQVPIIFMDRQYGNSKIPSNTLIKNMLLVPQIKIAGRHEQKSASIDS